MSNADIYTSEERKTLLVIAREAIKAVLNKTKPPEMQNVPDKFKKKRATFVTLRSANGQLRGCIGNIEPYEPLIASVPHNARNAALHDPRFPAVDSLAELATLKIEISVLTPPVEIDSYENIEIGKHGIILRHHNRGAVFLPQVPVEERWDKDATLSHLALKAGLHANAWNDAECTFRVFEAIYFSE